MRIVGQIHYAAAAALILSMWPGPGFAAQQQTKIFKAAAVPITFRYPADWRPTASDHPGRNMALAANDGSGAKCNVHATLWPDVWGLSVKQLAERNARRDLRGDFSAFGKRNFSKFRILQFARQTVAGIPNAGTAIFKAKTANPRGQSVIGWAATGFVSIHLIRIVCLQPGTGFPEKSSAVNAYDVILDTITVKPRPGWQRETMAVTNVKVPLSFRYPETWGLAPPESATMIASVVIEDGSDASCSVHARPLPKLQGLAADQLTKNNATSHTKRELSMAGEFFYGKFRIVWHARRMIAEIPNAGTVEYLAEAAGRPDLKFIGWIASGFIPGHLIRVVCQQSASGSVDDRVAKRTFDIILDSMVARPQPTLQKDTEAFRNAKAPLSFLYPKGWSSSPSNDPEQVAKLSAFDRSQAKCLIESSETFGSWGHPNKKLGESNVKGYTHRTFETTMSDVKDTRITEFSRRPMGGVPDAGTIEYTSKAENSKFLRFVGWMAVGFMPGHTVVVHCFQPATRFPNYSSAKNAFNVIMNSIVVSPQLVQKR